MEKVYKDGRVGELEELPIVAEAFKKVIEDALLEEDVDHVRIRRYKSDPKKRKKRRKQAKVSRRRNR